MSSVEYYLELSENPVRFEAVNQLTTLFYDDSNKQVFTVRSGGVMGVVVKGSDNNDTKPLSFRMEDHGPLLSIKFSPDQKVLAVQRSKTSVEFMNFNGCTVDEEYSQSCKKNSNILGFVWSQFNEVCFITDHGIELYTVIAEKKNLRFLKSTSATAHWFVWCPMNKIALLASSHGSQLQPVLMNKPGCISKLPKVETEPGRMALERDVTLSMLYNIPAVLILRHQSGPQSAEVHVHTLTGPGQAPVKTHVLKLGLSGRFAINVSDDLILVHHQASRSSQIFDIALPGESDGTVRYHTAVAPAKSFKPAQLVFPGIVEPQTHFCELYSPNWVVFQPDIVIDVKLGCLWHIKLCLAELCGSIADLALCTQVVLRRTNGKPILVKTLLEAIRKPKPCLHKIKESFYHINKAYRDKIETEVESQTAHPVATASIVNASGGAGSSKTPSNIYRVVLDQMDFYHEIFHKLEMEKDLTRLEWALVAFVTSLAEQGIPAQHNIGELIITTLVKRNKFSSLQQFLQYGVVSDSKPLACLLLSLSNMHPAASQLALDMLARLSATEEIQEILLSEGQVLSALKLCGKNRTEDVIGSTASSVNNPRKYLQASLATGDKALFHSVMCYFQSRYEFQRVFKKDERLSAFLQEYNSTFNGTPKP